MNKQLNEIILSITRLLSSDQQWILNQLSPNARRTLQKHQGFNAWHNALSPSQQVTPTIDNPAEKPMSLPLYSASLASKTPLYTAIILAQGQYPWQALFLKRYDPKGQITPLIAHAVHTVKTPIKLALFQAWEENTDFERHLEGTHG